MPFARWSVPPGSDRRGLAPTRSRSAPSRGSGRYIPPPRALRDADPKWDETVSEEVKAHWWQRRIGQEVRCRYKQGSRQDRFRVVIPVKCGEDKLVIYDPEIAKTACYRYSLIEVEQESLPPAAPFEDALVADDRLSSGSEEELIADDHEDAAADSQIVDADAAGGAN